MPLCVSALAGWCLGGLVPWWVGVLAGWCLGGLVPWWVGALVGWCLGVCMREGEMRSAILYKTLATSVDYLSSPSLSLQLWLKL